MAQKVGEIYYEVGADIAPLLQGSSEANAALDAMGGRADKASGSMDGLERSAKNTGKAVVRAAEDASNAAKIIERLGNEIAILEEESQNGSKSAAVLAAQIAASGDASKAQSREIGELTARLYDMKSAQSSAARESALAAKQATAQANEAAKVRSISTGLTKQIALLNEEQKNGARSAAVLAARLQAGSSATAAQRREIGELAGKLYDLKQAQDQANASQQKSSGIMGGIRTGLTSIASAIAISQLVQYGRQFIEIADSMTQLQARIDRLSPSVKEGAATFQSLALIASETGASLKDTEKLWETLTSSLQSAGASNAQILTLTDTLQKIGKIGGASSMEMANALRQFGQSIASGTVRAEEFNSIVEQMPELARQIAAGLGVTNKQLTQLMRDGKLSAEDALNAIMKQTNKVNQEFSSLPRTVDQATNSLSISFQGMIKQINDTSHASNGMVHVIDSITAAIDRLSGKVPTATQQIADLNSTADMFARRARTYSWLGLDGWAAQAEGMNAVSNKAAALIGDLSAIARANSSASSQPIKISGSGDSKEVEKLEKNTKRKLELSRLEGEARARLQAQYDAEDAGINDSKRIKALQDDYAATEKNSNARKAATAEGKKSASQAESDAQKLEVLRQKSEQVADTTKELSRSQAILQAQQSLSKSATPVMIQQAGEYAAKIWDQANALKAKQQAEQAGRFSAQQSAAADAAVNPYSGESANPYAQVAQEEQQKLDALAKYQAIGAVTEQQAQDTRTAIVKQAAYARMQIVKDETQKQVDSMNTMLGGFQAGFEGLANIISRGAGESSSAYKALFAVSKGFAVAQAGLNLQLAISNAMASGPFPWNMANMATVAAAGGQLVSAIGGASYGGARKNGGPVSAGSMYQVGEGGRPEIYQASTGKQYMIPGDNGKVISNKDMMGGAESSGGVVMHVAFNIQTTNGIDEATQKQMAQMMQAVAIRTIKDQQRPSGLLRK